ncbi:MAG: Gfo/Idh/MocA family oxidoreductase [Armatimonadota bacterium]|nr:Gfo/Idh/MocA family oxidoreductase [Armatimonadota bacterium]
MANKVRIGVIGVGGMGTFHARYLKAGEVKRCELTAVCDIDPDRLKDWTDIPTFTDSRELIRSGLVDAVLIATPHYDHTTIGIDAFQNGLHVLTEKPISVHKADCEKLIAAYKASGKVFSVMYQMRTEPLCKKVKQLLNSGELGQIVRINWIVTDWFRTQAYYDSGGWRATWKGEGGGVLLNQCPHNLDLLQWWFGMPSKIRAFCGFGKWHDIEVEDAVTAYLEYPNGATGVFVTTTGEAPGTNRLEVAGDRGKLVVEGGKITFIRNEEPMLEFLRTCPRGFGKPAVWNIEIPYGREESGHKVVTQNFVDAILDGAERITPGEEGINSVELVNCMLYSTWTDSTVALPLDGAAYEAKLRELCATSRFEKKEVKAKQDDIASSFKSV